MNALHRPLIPNENGNGVKDSFIEDGQPDSDENNASTCHHSSTISDVEVMSPFLVNKDSEVPLPGPITQDGSGNKEEEAVTSMGVPQPPVLDDTPSPSGPLQTNSDDVPADNARTEDSTVDSHFELLLMGSACRKRLLGTTTCDGCVQCLRIYLRIIFCRRTCLPCQIYMGRENTSRTSVSLGIDGYVFLVRMNYA